MAEHSTERREPRRRGLEGDGLTAYGTLRGNDAQSAIVNAVAAHDADRAAGARSEYTRRWYEKIASAEGFWAKLRAIIVG